MQLAMHDWMRVEPTEASARRMSNLGYDSYCLKGEPDEYDWDEVGRLLDKYGLDCWGSVTLMFGDRNLLAEDEAQREASIDYVNACTDMVAAVGGEVVAVVPGTVGKIEPEASEEEEWQWAIDSMKAVYEHAEKRGVEIAIEPINRFETYFLNRADQALALAEETAPGCGVCLDTFHMNIEEVDMHEAIHEVGDRLRDFHVSDNNRMPAGMGHIDWPQVVHDLEDIGYDGAMAAEFLAPKDRTPADPYGEFQEEEEEIEISPEQKKFIEDHGGDLWGNKFFTWLTRQSIETLAPLVR